MNSNSILQRAFHRQKKRELEQPVKKQQHVWLDENYVILVWVLIGMLTSGVALATVVTLYIKQQSNTTSSTTAATVRIAVLRWKSEGTTVAYVTGSSSAALNQLNGPFGLVVDSLSTLYVTDSNNNRVVKWTKGASSGTTVAGNGTQDSSMSCLHSPGDVAVDTDGNVYVADAYNQRIQYWANGASSGTLVAGTTGSFGPALTQFNYPTSLVRDPSSGTLYISDTSNNRVIRYLQGASSGTIVAGGNGSGKNSTQLAKPYGLYFDSPTNSLLIANYGANNIVRWVLGATNWTLVAGSITGQSGNTSALLRGPIDVTLDPMGNIYVADRYNSRIQFFSSDGTNGTTIGGITGVNGANSTLLNNPYGLALDNQLNLYVSDNFNNRIQIFRRY